MQQEELATLTENGTLLVGVLRSNFKFERRYVSNARLFKCCILMRRKPRLLSCLISRICSCSCYQTCCRDRTHSLHAAPRLTHADLQLLGGAAGEASLDSGHPAGGCPRPPPHMASASRGHGRLCLTPNVVWDKQRLQLSVIFCLALALDHQTCVSSC